MYWLVIRVSNFVRVKGNIKQNLAQCKLQYHSFLLIQVYSAYVSLFFFQGPSAGAERNGVPVFVKLRH